MNSSTQLPLQAYKEKEIEVWKMYTDALREIVKEKDPIWKVTQIGAPYTVKHLQKNRCWIDVFVQRLEDQKPLTSKKTSKSFLLKGKIAFKVLTQEHRTAAYALVQRFLSAHFQEKVSIGEDGVIEIPYKKYGDWQTLLKRYFSPSLSIARENTIRQKVMFNKQIIGQKDIQKVREKLRQKQWKASKISVNANRTELTIRSEESIDPKDFFELGFVFQKQIFVFGTDTPSASLVPLEGIQLIPEEGYLFPSLAKENVSFVQNLLQDANPLLNIKQRPSRYVFRFLKDQCLFKTQTDLLGVSCFDIEKELLITTVDKFSLFRKEQMRIKKLCPKAIIKKQKYTESFRVLFCPEMRNRRRKIYWDIRRSILEQLPEAEITLTEDYELLRFEYHLPNPQARLVFEQALISACEPYETLLSYQFEEDYIVPTGAPPISSEKHLIARNNPLYTDLVFLEEEKYQNFKEGLKQGKITTFWGGEKIGELVQKEPKVLVLQPNAYFFTLSPETLSAGYLKSVPTGELICIDRMIRAMQKITSPNKLVGYPVNSLLPTFLFDPSQAHQPSAQEIALAKQKLYSKLKNPFLKKQPRQVEAVAKALITKDISLIQGPPGTGKTTVIVEIVKQALQLNPQANILIASQTHLAVDNVLERLPISYLIRPLRLGKTEKMEESGKVFSLERIRQWQKAQINSEEEKNTKDNVVEHWLKIAKKSYQDKQIAVEKYLKRVNVFVATCSECGSSVFAQLYSFIFKKATPAFDVVIIDEASKASVPELVLPLTLGKKLVLIGDHKQLPPMIDIDDFGVALSISGAQELVSDWERKDLQTSLFEKLFLNAPNSLRTTLETQFRMHEQIMNCISPFYRDQPELKKGLICGLKPQMNLPNLLEKGSRWHGFDNPPFITPDTHAIWVNVDTPEQKTGTSYQNEGEVNAIKKVLKALSKSDGFANYYNAMAKEEDKEIAVITYYLSQMQKIQKTLFPSFSYRQWLSFEAHKYENDFKIPLRINTVDKFQGMERNIVVVSTVRSDKQIDETGVLKSNDHYPLALGFARNFQRVNVAFSRAKRLLIVIGNEKHFAHKKEYAQAISKMHRIDISDI